MKDSNKKVRIGKIRNTHGLHGEMKVTPLTDFPDRFNLLDQVYVEDRQGRYTLYPVKDVRRHQGDILITLEGVDDVDAAKAYQNAYLAVDRKDRMPLPEGSFYVDDIIGCEVYEDDAFLGTVEDVVETGSNDVYVLKSSRWPHLCIPAIHDCILRIDIENNRIDVHLPKGLKE